MVFWVSPAQINLMVKISDGNNTIDICVSGARGTEVL